MNKTNLNNIELNAILYYADFLSLQELSIPITDNCKYFFIYKSPINSAYIIGNKPDYDENNEYFKRSYTEYMQIKQKFGIDGVLSFIDNIANIGVIGCVDGIRMLRCIHQYSQKNERYTALNKYKNYMKNIRFTHLIKTEDGKSIRTECTKYIAHDEKTKGLCTEPEVQRSSIETN